jgi:hypothetical protein
MFTSKTMPPKCTPLQSLWRVLYTQVENYIQKIQNCLVYKNVNQELPSRENCTIKHTHRQQITSMFLQQHDRTCMVRCHTSNITWSSQQCKSSAKENCIANFLGSQIQAQKASTLISKTGPQVHFREKMATISTNRHFQLVLTKFFTAS